MIKITFDLHNEPGHRAQVSMIVPTDDPEEARRQTAGFFYDLIKGKHKRAALGQFPTLEEV